MIFKEIKNNEEDLIFLKNFLDNAGDSSLKYFKYFKRRNLSSIEQHILTSLILDDDSVVCYGHLDLEDNITWLGICVSEIKVGMGYGRHMMKYLIDYADRENIKEITLTVNIKNILALSLFKKFGFEIVDTSNEYHTMIRKSSN